MAEAKSGYRILSLDGGGAKGFYTLGVLNQLEALLGERPLSSHFDLIFGTSTGAIIASLLALGKSVAEIRDLYKVHVPQIMSLSGSASRSAALERLADEVYQGVKFDSMKTGIGIVATRWLEERPMIFKTDRNHAHSMKATFQPGFGCTVGDAVVASCSAYPIFNRKIVKIADGSKVELFDGGYCANNPTLYAIADATMTLKLKYDQLRVVSIGVGSYPKPTKYWHNWIVSKFFLVQLLHKTIDTNTHSMEVLTTVLFRDVPLVRINDTYNASEIAVDLMEHNLKKLEILYQRGGESFGKYEAALIRLLA